MYVCVHIYIHIYVYIYIYECIHIYECTLAGTRNVSDTLETCRYLCSALHGVAIAVCCSVLQLQCEICAVYVCTIIDTFLVCHFSSACGRHFSSACGSDTFLATLETFLATLCDGTHIHIHIYMYVCVHIYECPLAVARKMSQHLQPLLCASFALEYIHTHIHI